MDDSEEEGDDAIRKVNVVSAHKMGRDDLMRSNEIRDNLMRSDKADDNLVRSEEEEEVEDVMSCLFEWDFDQLLRQAEIREHQYWALKILGALWPPSHNLKGAI